MPLGAIGIGIGRSGTGQSFSKGSPSAVENVRTRVSTAQPGEPWPCLQCGGGPVWCKVVPHIVVVELNLRFTAQGIATKFIN